MCVKFFKKWIEKLLSVRVVELTAFQRSKILDVDDDTYPIISGYRDFILEQHETYPHSSEQYVAYQSNVAM
jgi:hypothetical protein